MPFKDPAARAAHNRRWRERNRDKVRSSQRAKSLRREFGGDLDTATVRWALETGCAYCGDAATQVEHCTPLSRGGRNDADNVVGACEACNTRKRCQTVLEFLRLWPGSSGLDTPF